MKKIESIILVLCGIIFLQAESFSSDYLVFATPNNTIEVLDFKEFNPFIFVEDGEIVNKEKYNKNDFDWFHSFSLWSRAHNLTYDEWKSHMTDEYASHYTSEEFRYIQEKSKNDKKSLRKTIVSYVKFKYLTTEYLLIRNGTGFLTDEVKQDSSIISQLFEKNKNKWLRTLQLRDDNQNIKSFNYNFFFTPQQILSQQIFFNLPKTKKAIEKNKSIEFPRNIAIADLGNSFFDCVFADLEFKDNDTLDTIIENSKIQKEKLFWLKDYFEEKEKLSERKCQSFFSFSYNTQFFVCIFFRGEELNHYQLLSYDKKGQIIKDFLIPDKLRFYLDLFFNCEKDILRSILKKHVFSIDKNGKTVEGFSTLE